MSRVLRNFPNYQQVSRGVSGFGAFYLYRQNDTQTCSTFVRFQKPRNSSSCDEKGKPILQRDLRIATIVNR